VFRRFVSVFARPEHPLALFLDDLHWLDAATLDLLEDLLTRSDLHHLMLIGTYRDNEVDALHPLRQKLDAIKNTGGKVAEITLAPLAREHLGQLIADTLRCEPQRGAPLAQLVHEKTGGNPFFAIQFVSSLAEEGMLVFDHDAALWSWDLNRIHAKGYTDNVVDLMVGKLTRLPADTQNALQLLACLGNSAEVTTLSIVLERYEEQLHTALWPAVQQELIERLTDAYRFAHDRVQEAAYSLIPKELRDKTHLRIGRRLVARIPAEKREEGIFDVVNQLDRGAALITSRHEREQVAELNLLAGKRAKASTAYASALTYLVTGAALLPGDSWERRHELAFELELLRAECEFLTGAMAAADERLNGLSTRAADTVERASVACLHVDLYTTLAQSSRAIDVGLDYLKHLGIEWSPRPTDEDVRREYERIWSELGSRMIEDLIELPLMRDPSSLATMDVLTKLGPSSLQTDANLFSLVICRAVNLSLDSGNCDGSCFAYVRLGMVAGSRFGDYQAAHRFGRLGHDLVERHGLKRFQARTYMCFGCFILPWTRHVRTGRDLLRRALQTANEMGDLTYVAYSGDHLTTNLLAAGDPLVDMQREAEKGLAFAQKARFGLVIAIAATQLGLIRTLRGLTPTFGSFDDGQFDELRIERRFTRNPDLAVAECKYWIRKLQARFFAGEYAVAVEASSRAQSLLWALPSHFETAEYHFYGALSRAASCDSAPPGERQQHMEALAAHHKQLKVWAANCSENFENRAALVAGEIARRETRDIDAMRLYEQAIRLARENGFVQNEGIANELAARFYAARGFDKIARVYLRDARHCYLHWGANGKVRQLDELYPYLREDKPVPGSTSTIAARIEQLDLGTVIKVSQAVSGEIVLEKLLDTIMRTAIAQAGAERVLLILARGAAQRIAAEATTSGDTVTVHLRDEAVAETVLPESMVHYVLRTRESVILDDAAAQSPFAADPYFRQRQARSVLCLPLLNQAKLIGVLYLENNLAPRVFAPSRIAVLKLLASQAAISLENSRLYSDLQEREAKIRRLVDANIIGIFIWELEGNILEANDTFLRMVGYEREDLLSERVRWTDLTPPEWRDRTARAVEEMKITGTAQPWEKEYVRKDGSRVPVLIGSAAFDEPRNRGVAFVLDLTERKRAEERLRVQHTISQILAEAATIEEVTSKILRAMGEYLGWDVGALWRLDREADALRCVELWHKASIEVPEFERVSRDFTFVPGLGLPGRVWSSLEPKYIPDVVSDEKFPRGPTAQREGLHAAFAFPILLGGEVLGVIEFFSREIRQPDQELLKMLATIGSQIGQFIERKRAEAEARESERRYREVQMEFAHANRVATMGQLSASIAHEVRQPIGAVSAHAHAALRWLDRRPPELEEVRQALAAIVKDNRRAGNVIGRISDLIKKAPPRKDRLEVNGAIGEVIELTHAEAVKNGVSVQTDLAQDLPFIEGDRVQLQQLIVNLIMNAVEAMSGVGEETRELLISTRKVEPEGVLVEVRDTGPGLAPTLLKRVFDAFYTTKPSGMGMGLSICQSIIEAHGGRLWASTNVPHGATFQFTLPGHPDTT
jgi:PAS domain S-box-containing protein